MKSLMKGAVAGMAALSVLGLASCGKKAEKSNVLDVMIEVEVQSLDPQQATDGTSFEVIADYTDGLKQMAGDGSTINALCA